MGFSETEKWDMFNLCAGLMHMGEMKFKQRGEQAEPEDDIEGQKLTSNFDKLIDDGLLLLLQKRRRLVPVSESLMINI